MSDANEHLASSEHPEHIPVEGSTEDGACLFHNEPKYKPVSCSYRWQGKQEKRPNHVKVYRNYPVANLKQKVLQRGIENDYLRTMQRETKKGGQCPAQTSYDAKLKLPEERGDWDLDGPSRFRPSPAAAPTKAKKYIPPTRNFTTAFWPYWNNAHHLIPKGHFAGRIMAIKDPDLRELVTVGLFRGKYNINHFKNVIFLPMDEEVGMLLRLPRHLTLDGDASVKTPGDFADHTEYTARVDDGLEPVIDAYVEEARAARGDSKKCEIMKTITLSREQLERLSEQCFTRIVSFGKESAGASLNDLVHL